MDNPLPTTPANGNTVSDETDDSSQLEWDPKNDDVVLAQPVIEGPVTPLAPSANDPPPNDAGNPFVQGTQNPPTKDDGNIQNLPA